MKGILRKVAGAFVEIEDRPVSQPPPNIQPTVVQSATSNSEIDKFREKFRDILKHENERNYPGNDYYEFVVMKNAMSAIPQENVKYQAAFAGWAVGGNQSKQKLLDTARVYLGLVEKEIKDFEEAYKVQYETQVGGNQKLIDQKVAEVQQLVEKMNLLNGEIQDLKQQNINNTINLTSTHDSFMSAGETQKQEIIGEIDKINMYIN